MKAYVWPVDGTPPPTTTPSRWRRFVENALPSLVIYLMVATLVAIVLYPHMVVTVPSGQIGVLWKRFGGGTVLDPRKLKNEGFNLILPWNRVFLYDLRLQSFTEPYSYCVTNFGICSEPRSMGNAIASWRERRPISVALLQSSSERGVQAATADPLGW